MRRSTLASDGDDVTFERRNSDVRECAGMSLERRGREPSVVRCQLEASDNSFVAALAYRAFRMACRHPGNSPLRVGDDIWEPLGRDAKHPHRLIPGVREGVQAVPTFREVDDVAG